ncbi:MAG: DNA internalization-related competence protein ComEC/Rec2 [Lachnospiraceae bacterium]|nr:DNA internalization-related competence protein ComEC/Rec2 [Lachnospiraceae bacterium]
MDRQLAETGAEGFGLSVFCTIISCAGAVFCAWMTMSVFSGEICFSLRFLQKRRFWYGMMAAVCFFIGGRAGTEAVKLQKPFEALDGKQIEASGVVEQISEKDGMITLLVKNVEIKKPVMEIRGEKLHVCFEAGENRVRPGQRVVLSGRFSLYPGATNPGAFDYREYCFSLRIMGRVECSLEQIKLLGDGFWVRESLFLLRGSIREQILRLASQEDAGILICLLTGDKSELDDYWKSLYQESGIIHLLTISGLHISILGMGIFHFLRRVLGGFVGSSLISGLAAGAFCMMAGEGTSMVRAVICFLLFLLAGCLGKSYDLLTAAAVSGILILTEYPLLLFQAGFLMTFGCVLGIGFLLPLGELLFLKEEGSAVLRYLQKALLGAFWLQLFSLPALLWFQGKVSPVGVWINLLTVPFMSLVLISACFAVAAGYFSASAGVFLLGASHYILAWYEQVCLFFRKLPFYQLVNGRPCAWQIILWLVLSGALLSAGYCFVLKKQRKLPFFAGILFFPAALLLLHRLPSDELVIHFLDVGQGDGMIMEIPGGSTFCIDGGSSSQKKLEEYVYEPYLSYAGIDSVDCWLITHPDSDHYSGMYQLLKNDFPIRHILLPEVFRNSEFAKKLEILHPIEYIEGGKTLQIGELRLEILHPNVLYQTEDENDASAVVYTNWEGTAMLFTGDMAAGSEPEVLKALRGRKADILKVAHHGSKGSTTAELLKQIAPRAAIISSGKNNRYGHPHRELTERLNEAGIRWWNTAESGCIRIVCKKNAFEVKAFTVR